MVAPYWTGSTSSVEQLDRLNKLCCTWLLIGQASVPDQPGARHNRACLTGLLITNLPLLFEKLNFTFIDCYGSSQVFLYYCAPCALSLGMSVLNSWTKGEHKENAAFHLNHILLEKA